MAYRAGKVDSIQWFGADRFINLRVHYTDYWPNFPLEGGGILNLIEPSHLLGELEVKDMESEIRSWPAPISCGLLEVERHILTDS